jgi:hypothetical protein
MRPERGQLHVDPSKRGTVAMAEKPKPPVKDKKG